MAAESQQMEWKASWQDDHLRSVCAFANSGGGRIEIGREDTGRVIGAPGARQLLEDLPNKLRDILGIVAVVNLREIEGKALVEIVVPPLQHPISLRGRYYVRSGSTVQELKGASLDRFLLDRHGRTWDEVVAVGATLRDLAPRALDRFRELAKAHGRLQEADLDPRAAVLVKRLNLLADGRLSRAAVLLFHPEPERLFKGAFVRLGAFRSPSDLAYHDTITGDLFTQVDRTLELLLSKYLRAAVLYSGVQRIERYPVPMAALREALLNALVHRDYAIPAPVQIKVLPDRLSLWNPAVLPEKWTLMTLLREHPSIPHNPALANAFFRAGSIETWGRGIGRIFDACLAEGNPRPRLQFEAGGIQMDFPFSKDYLKQLSGVSAPSPANPAEPSGKASVKASVKPSGKTAAEILRLIADQPTLTIPAIASALGLSSRAVEQQLQRLKAGKHLRRIGPARGGHWQVSSE
jgi:ATP-dependent DNA helicase RecG